MNSHYLLIFEYVSNYDNLIKQNKAKLYLLQPEFFPLFIEIFSQNELLYDYIDELYNSKITCYNKAATDSVYYKMDFLNRITYKRNIYAKKVLGILEFESDFNLKFIDACFRKGWRKLYKHIVNNGQWEMFDIMSRFADFSSPTDKSIIIALIVGGLYNKPCYESSLPSWAEKSSAFLNNCICFSSSPPSPKTIDTSKIDSFGFEYIKSFNDLYNYFNSDDNDCISEIKILTRHLAGSNKYEAVAYFRILLESNKIVKIQPSRIKKIIKSIGINNINFFVSLSQACVNYSLRNNVHFNKCFELFRLFNEILDRYNISKDIFETVMFTPRVYKEILSYVSKAIITPTPVDFLVAYLAFAITDIYNKQKEEAYSSSLLLPFSKLEKILSELQSSIDTIQRLENENFSLKSQCKYLEKCLKEKGNLEQENHQLLAKIQNLTKKVDDYKIQNSKLSLLLQELEQLAQSGEESVDTMILESPDMLQSFANFKICLIGGYPTWRNKFLTNFPCWSILSQPEAMRFHFDEKELDLIVINIIGIPHSLFYKVTTQLSNYDKLLIVNTSNYELTFKLIKQRLLNKNTSEENI